MTSAGQIFLSSIPILISLYAGRYREQDKVQAFKDDSKTLGLPVQEYFDFIIVGGGTGGCVMAARLSDQNFTVLLLEAGGNPPPLQEVPFVASITKDLQDINFLYKSVPQKNARLIHGGILETPVGKMLGGSSSHNDQIYQRGNPLDFKLWSELTKDESWLYKNILKFFKKAENYFGKFKSRGQHGRGGPMTVTGYPRYAPGLKVWLEAGKELGYKIIDPNGPQQEGFSPNDFTKKFGRRVSTYNAYIEPIEDKQRTLTVRRYSLVSKIIIENKVARGVEYEQHGLPKVARARREVILCAGVFMTPILLIKSGIGPKSEIKKAQVEPVSILPGVGENLMDHPYLEVGPFFVKDHSKAWEISQNLTFQDFSDFIRKGDGPLVTSYRVGQGNAFIESKNAKSQHWPDLQFYYTFMGSEKNALSCYVGLNRPQSRGRLTLNASASSMDSQYLPIIDYKYFSNENDFDVIIQGINFCLNTIEKTKAFQEIGAKFTMQPIPQCRGKQFRSNDYWKCYTRYLVDASYHVVGTCKMGIKDDPMAVVDSKLRVFGVRRLRVVDASIFPVITNANTAAPTVMIAEKAAHSITRKYKRKRRNYRSTKNEF